MKQTTLAHEDRISEKAVQRVERGEKVSDDTLVVIAKEPQLAPDALTRLTDATPKTQIRCTASRFKMIEARRLLALRGL